MGAEQEPPEGGESENAKSEGNQPENVTSGSTQPADDKSVAGKQPEDLEPPRSVGESNQSNRGQGESTKCDSGGSIKHQDASTTRPRPATPAELRARQKFADKQREIEEARLAAEEKRRKQKRVLMGAAAAVGVVGVVAGLGYWLLTPDAVTAQCVQEDPHGQPVVVPDSYCTGHTEGLSGFFYYGGHQYRYYYGSSGSIGSRPTGGTTTAPRGSRIITKSGTTISRGGLGGSGGKGSGGSSGS